MSRRSSLENKKQMKQSAYFFFGGIASLIFFLIIGLPILVAISSFLSTILSPKSVIKKNNNRYLQQPQLEIPFEATNSASISVNGFGPVNTEVSLVVNNNKDQSTSDKNGRFSFSKVNLSNGENELYVVAKDKSTDKEIESNIVRVIYDNKKPELTIENIKDGDKIELNNLITIKGKLNEEGTLYLNDRFVMVNSDKTFSYDYELNDGDNVLKFKAIDKATNFSEKEMKINFHK